MIQEVKRQIHFTPYISVRGKPKDTEAPPIVTVDRKYNKLIFPGRTIRTLGMENKFIALYYEPTKKIIGWRVKDKLAEGELLSKTSKWKLVKITVNGNYILMIKGLLKEFNGSLTEEKYAGLEVKKYIEQEGIIDKGDTYYFVEVKKDYSQKELVATQN